VRQTCCTRFRSQHSHAGGWSPPCQRS
jgi:hypothetical protein